MTTTQIEALAAKLVEAGLNAKVWQGRRIYFNGYGKDIKAYIDLDTPEYSAAECGYLYQGCALKVFTNAENVSRKWAVNRVKPIKHALMKAIYAAGVCGPMGAPCENAEDVI